MIKLMLSTHSIRTLTAAICVLVFVGSTFAQELQRQPTTAPTTQQLTPADSTTPKGTLTLFNRATQSGDPSSVKDLFNATTPQEKKLAEMLIERASVFAKFRQAAVKAFGEDAATQLTGTSEADATESEQRISQADVKIDKDNATVLMKTPPGEPQPEPVKLVRVDGQWKLSISNLVEGMQPAEVEEHLQEMKLLSGVVTETTDEVGQGRYKSANEVNDAMRSKLAAVMLQQAGRGGATSRPAPGPVDR
jgi:hypothetical protein